MWHHRTVGKKGMFVTLQNSDTCPDEIPCVKGEAEAEPVHESAPPSPFAPAGIEFRPVSADLVKVRLISTAIGWALALVAVAVAAIWLSSWVWVGFGVALAVMLWDLWITRRQVRAIGYAEGESELYYRSGIMFRHLTVVPYGRLQYVEVKEGPIARHFGIASVQLHTASASADVSIPGLPTAEAARLRDFLASRGEQEMMGL